MHRPSIVLGPIIVDCTSNQAKILSEFHSKLLGWTLSHPANEGTAAITSLNGQVIAFQETDTYIKPIWPWKKGTQGQMMHFDLLVDDLEEGIAFAVSCGATLAPEKFFEDSRTLFDPAGHPFCLDTYHE